MPVNQDIAGLPFGAQTRNPFNYQKFEQIQRDVSTSWLTLTQITNQLNLFDDESQDDYLQGLELAVRMAIEDFLGLSIFATKYRVYYGPESFGLQPACLDLPEISQNAIPTQPNLVIESVGYYNSSGVFTTLDPSGYLYDNSGNKIIVNNLPTDIDSNRTAPIVATYVTAPSVLATYPVIQQAGLLLLTHLYNQRDAATNPIQHKIPYGIEMLLRPYKPLVM
jgi:hypothetical protein